MIGCERGIVKKKEYNVAIEATLDHCKQSGICMVFMYYKKHITSFTKDIMQQIVTKKGKKENKNQVKNKHRIAL